MRRHDRCDTCGNRRSKRDELDGIQAIGRVFDERELMMGIRTRVAMPRKMLATRRNSRVLQRRDDDPAEPGDILRAFRQGALKELASAPRTP